MKLTCDAQVDVMRIEFSHANALKTQLDVLRKELLENPKLIRGVAE